MEKDNEREEWIKKRKRVCKENRKGEDEGEVNRRKKGGRWQ